MRVTIRTAFSLVVALLASPSVASVAPAGSLITSGVKLIVYPSPPPSVGFVRIEDFTPQGAFIRTITTTSPGNLVGPIASDRFGNLLALSDAFGGSLVKINDDGSQSSFSVPLQEGASLSPDQNGNVYISYSRISKISPSGQVVAMYTPGTPFAQFIDLAPDQCTMYFTDTVPTVYRFDVCRGVALPPLATTLPPGVAGDLRVLPSGLILVTDGAAGVVLIDPTSGAVVRTYPVPSQLLALATDGTSFWAGGGPLVRRVDLQSGAILATVNTGLDQLNGLTVVGEPRAAFAASIPTFSPEGLVALALALAAAGLLAVRRL